MIHSFVFKISMRKLAYKFHMTIIDFRLMIEIILNNQSSKLMLSFNIGVENDSLMSFKY